ncbi:Uncharacterised protein [Enterobacter kobei]|nr:Uncharacterised protein [Enterobacter kobei]
MVVAALPYWANGVNHRFGRKVARKRNHRMARRAFALLLTHDFTGFQQLRSGSAVNSTVNPASPHQGRIGRIDDDIDMLGRNIAMNHFNLRFHKSPLLPAFFLSVSQRGY